MVLILKRISLSIVLLLVAIALSGAENARQKELLQKLSAPQFLNSSSESILRFSYPLGQTELNIIRINKSGHWHLGLDLNLAEYLGSQALGELIEEYLLAYFIGADLHNYLLKARLPKLSKEELATQIAQFGSDLQLSTTTSRTNEIQVTLSNSKISLSFLIPLSLPALYANVDKKQLEEDLLHQLLSADQDFTLVPVPMLEELTPYQDSLYVWQRSGLDSLFTASMFLVARGDTLAYVDSPRYPLESLYNYLLMPQAFKHELAVQLQFLMYGQRIERLQLDYSMLHNILSAGRQCAVAICPVKTDAYQVLIMFYDPVSGIRHILYGYMESLVHKQSVDWKLMSYIVGSADEMQYSPGKEPTWQLKIK